MRQEINMQKLQCVPPAPRVMSALYMDFLRVGKSQNLTFRQYLEAIGYVNHAQNIKGMDDGYILNRNGELELIPIPPHPVIGKLHVKVLLIDFEDRKGYLPRQHYENLLFSENSYPTGSMRDYYEEVSHGKVEITGRIHGWFRMPEPYSFYTNYESGLGGDSYPRNAQRMAEDAVRKALEYEVEFEPELDKLNQGIITALFIIHAGLGAEELIPNFRPGEIWSHKWSFRNPVDISPNLSASTYLAVPQDCDIGACCHELGHLAFQWDDFYDPNYTDDGKEWAGSGSWDLMAGGTYNLGSLMPAHPAGLHKIQHHWVTVEEVKKSKSITLGPVIKSGKLVKIISPVYNKGQYLLLENRTRAGFDFGLPGEGLLVWRVDESKDQETPDKPALLLIQADGRHELEIPKDWNEGDAGDPFPGSTNQTFLGDTGDISTSFPGQPRSGVSLANIAVDPISKTVTLDVEISSS